MTKDQFEEIEAEVDNYIENCGTRPFREILEKSCADRGVSVEDFNAEQKRRSDIAVAKRLYRT